MRKFLSTLLLTISILIFAQESKERNWVLKLNATQLIDVTTFPTIQFSAERKINHYFSINTEAGIQAYDFQKFDSTILKSKGFKANIEGRFYISKFFHKRTNSKRNEPFLGLQFFCRKDQTTDILYYYKKNSSLQNDYPEDLYNDYFGVKTSVYGVNLTFGNQFYFKYLKNLIFEPYGGFGIINRKIRNTNLQYDETKHEIYYGNQDFFRNNNLEQNSGKDGNIFFGIRIGYTL